MTAHSNLMKMSLALLCLFFFAAMTNASNSEIPPYPDDPIWYLDDDGDGYGNPLVFISAPNKPVGYVNNGDDCNDENPIINPEQPETCNGYDDNCNGKTDEDVVPIWYKDADNDLYSDGTTLEQCTEPGGYKLAVNLFATSGDCNDDNPDVNPGATEVCNDRDDNCNGETDEGVMVTWYADFDNDNHSDGSSIVQCVRPGGHKKAIELSSTDGDCNDNDPDVNPDATEVCNDKDDNCNGETDEGVMVTWYADFDNDNHSDGSSIVQCVRPGGHKKAIELSSTDGDCNDNDPDVNPDATEVCNDKDDNCNGDTDEGVMVTWYADFDNDNHSDGSSIVQCVRPGGHKKAIELSSTDGDCNDNDPDVNPDATEVCNDKDDNCDGNTDENVIPIWYKDIDNDGYSDGTFLEQCVEPGGYKIAANLFATSGDCNDDNPDVNPGAAEICNDIDDNCNGDTDEGVMVTWYADFDNDNHSDGSSIVQCVRPGGHKKAIELSSTDGDCNDNDPDVNPDATEVCNDKDDNCNGETDEGVMVTWYADFDNDNHSDGSSIVQCIRPGGHKMANELSSTDGDCNDNDPDVNPDATEVCNDKDDNCDGNTDENVIPIWYKDLDNDGYSDGTFLEQCVEPSGYKIAANLFATSGDCNDDNPDVNPGATEFCNGIDDNCNGDTDEAVEVIWYKDLDNDGYSDGQTLVQCEEPGGYKLENNLFSTSGDCNDDNPAVNPGATEICNTIDDNCDGQMDENVIPTWYKDLDNDGYSDGQIVEQCENPGGYKLAVQLTATSGDCNDDNPSINPAATEICDGIDNNCDGQMDENVIPTWYKDIDNDGYSDGQSITQCNNPGGFNLAINLIALEGDCNDEHPGVHPAATEICDGIDNNCNGFADNNDETLVDNENPVASCNSIVIELDVNGEITIAMEDIFDQEGSYDNCGNINLLSLSKDHFTCANIGINHITLNIDDGHGNQAACVGIVRVKDTMKPAVSCKLATVSLNYIGEVEAHPTTVFLDGYDNCTNFYLSLEPNNFTCDDIGPNFVTLYSEDDHENVNFCHSTITIIDDIAPDIYCKPHTVYLDENGQGTMVPSDVYLDSYDNCGTVNLLSVLPNTFDCSNLTNLGGENIVELTVDDGHGNSSACTADVTVVDAISPIPNCQPITHMLNESGLFTIPPVDLFAGGWDNCNVLNPQSVSPPTLDCDQVGVNPVTLTVNDGNGNTGTCETTVTILAGPYFTWYKDFDADDWSDGAPVIEQCDQPIGYDLAMNLIALSGDCNDLDPFVHPERFELCNGIDDDCDGTVDEIVVTSISISNMSDCDDNFSSNPTDDIFTVDVTVTFDDIPPVGTLDLSGDGTASVPVAELSGSSYTFIAVEMPSDGTPINLTAVFPVSAGCEYSVTDLGTAPISCSPCEIMDISVSNMGNCNSYENSDPEDDTFTADVTVTYFNPPASGSLDLSGDGTSSVDVMDLSGGSYTFTGVQMAADGGPIDLSANFSAGEGCDLSNSNTGLAMNSCCEVIITSLNSTGETCEGTGDGTLEIIAEGTGTLLYSIDGGSSFSYVNTFTNLSPGEVDVLVKVSGDGCTDDGAAAIAAGSPSQEWWKDMDGDGYTDGTTITSCSQPTGYVASATAGDCNDSNPEEHPGQTWYEDLDGDGHASSNWFTACLRPSACYLASELTATSGDCDDDDANIHPDAPEICNGIDDNCDGNIDEDTEGGLTWEGNVNFSSQDEVDDWDSCYSTIDGNLTIQNSDISNLSNLINLVEVTGNVYIKSTSIVNMAGLDNLTTIGGYLKVQTNNSMTTLNGLGGITSVGGYLKIYFNNILIDCCAIYDLMGNNGVDGSITIFRNDSGCDSVSEIEDDCEGTNPLMVTNNNSGTLVPVEVNSILEEEEETEVLFNSTFEIVPNPSNGLITVYTDELPAGGQIQVNDLYGRIIMEQNIAPNTHAVNLDLTAENHGIYFLVLKVKGQEDQVQRVVKR